jgi:hypothetical protein
MTGGWDPLGASVIETDDRGGGRRPGAGADEPGDRRPVEHGRRVVAGAESGASATSARGASDRRCPATTGELATRWR